MLPNAWSSTRFPAVRMTKRSPRFWSKISSGAVRESAHPSMMAKGCCSCAVSARRAAMGLLWDSSLEANRRLPSFSLARAASALTEAAGCSAARTRAATLEQAMVARTLNVILMVYCYQTAGMKQRLTKQQCQSGSDLNASRSGKLCCKDIDLLNDGRFRKKLRGFCHQRCRDFSREVRLPPGLIRKSVEDPERCRPKANSEPGHRRGFFLDNWEPAAQKVFDLRLF